MHLGETLMALGALVLFAFASLNINAAKLDNESGMMESEFMVTATGIAQSYVHQAKGLSFDEATADSVFNGPVPDSFTAPDALGPESGEIFPNFDDLDDLHGYTGAVVTPRSDYSVSIQVQYADTLNLTPQSSARTLMKILNVRIASVYMQDTLQINQLFGFH